MVLTDHNPLRRLQSQSICSRRQARWVLAMQEFDFEFKYRQGKANDAADALSRKETKQIQPTRESSRTDEWKATLPISTISTVQYDTHMISQLMTEYLQDSEFAKQFQSPKALYALRDGCSNRDGRFCVPNGSLRGILLHDHHDAATAGHRGATKTIRTLQHQYYWGSLAKDVRDYVRTCDACQRAKSDRRRRAGLSTPHSPPMTKWSEMSIDFMFESLETDAANTGLAVVVDKISKQAHFLPLKPDFSAQDLAYVYIQEIFRHHGLSSKSFPTETQDLHPRSGQHCTHS
jgi:Integrase zinc binding domain